MTQREHFVAEATHGHRDRVYARHRMHQVASRIGGVGEHDFDALAVRVVSHAGEREAAADPLRADGRIIDLDARRMPGMSTSESIERLRPIGGMRRRRRASDVQHVQNDPATTPPSDLLTHIFLTLR
jgi:hypothetical protein